MNQMKKMDAHSTSESRKSEITFFPAYKRQGVSFKDRYEKWHMSLPDSQQELVDTWTGIIIWGVIGLIGYWIFSSLGLLNMNS